MDYRRKTATDNHVGLGISCFTLGAALGACMTALYTPRSGKRMRRMLWRKAEDAQDRAKDTSRHLAERGRDLYEKSSKFALTR